MRLLLIFASLGLATGCARDRTATYETRWPHIVLKEEHRDWLAEAVGDTLAANIDHALGTDDDRSDYDKTVDKINEQAAIERKQNRNAR